MKNDDFFNFLENTKFQITKYSIESNLLKNIRFCLRNIYSVLLDTEEVNSITAIFRLELLKLQSSPFSPSLETFESFALSDFERNSKKWGSDFSANCVQLEKSINAFNQNISPLLAKLLEVVTKEVETYALNQLRIWCYKRDQQLYIDAFSELNLQLTEKNFISSLAEYKRSDLFEILIRIGPLRSQGWSKTPLSILSAPKYKKLLRFCWSHTSDEETFGLEPVTGAPDFLNYFTTNEELSIKNVQFENVTNYEITFEDQDDFKFLVDRPITNNQTCSSSVLIEFPGQKGVLLTLGSHQLIFNQRKIFKEKPAKEIEQGDFLVLNNIQADLGSSNIFNQRYKFSSIWKKALQDKYINSPDELMENLKKSGVYLLDLHGAIKRWIQPDNEVISAPQNKKHFELLFNNIFNVNPAPLKWQKAWHEIMHSRVNAIQEGRIEHSILNEQVLQELEKRKEELHEKCLKGDFFNELITSEAGIFGTISFYPVITVSSGFQTPKDKLEHINSISDLEPYRSEL